METSTGFIAVCVCGRVCTSRAGTTLHQRACTEAQAYKKKGLPMTRDTDIVTNNDDEYVTQVKELIEMVHEMADDANKALINGNKSAGRRARIALTSIKNKITPLRQEILTKMKDKSETESEDNVIPPGIPDDVSSAAG